MVACQSPEGRATRQQGWGNDGRWRERERIVGVEQRKQSALFFCVHLTWKQSKPEWCGFLYFWRADSKFAGEFFSLYIYVLSKFIFVYRPHASSCHIFFGALLIISVIKAQLSDRHFYIMHITHLEYPNFG